MLRVQPSRWDTKVQASSIGSTSACSENPLCAMYKHCGRPCDCRPGHPEWIVGKPSTTAHPTQGFGSMPMRSLTADRIRCLHQSSAPSYEPKRAPREIGSALTRLPKHGRVEHRSVADRAAPTSPLRYVWRIPSRCAKPPAVQNECKNRDMLRRIADRARTLTPVPESLWNEIEWFGYEEE